MCQLLLFANSSKLACDKLYSVAWEASSHGNMREADLITKSCEHELNSLLSHYQLLQAKINYAKQKYDKSLFYLIQCRAMITSEYMDSDKTDIKYDAKRFSYIFMLKMSAIVNYELKNWEETIQDVNKYLQIQEDDSYMIYLASAYSKLNLNKKALDTLLKAYKINTSGLNAFYVASAYSDNGDYLETLKWLRLSLTKDKTLVTEVAEEKNFDKFRNRKEFSEIVGAINQK